MGTLFALLTRNYVAYASTTNPIKLKLHLSEWLESSETYSHCFLICFVFFFNFRNKIKGTTNLEKKICVRKIDF